MTRNWIVARRLIVAYLKDRRQFSRKSRGRKLVRQCPICGYEGRFLSLERGARVDSRCPLCGSRERHRLMHLFLTEGGADKLAGKRILHFAPERHMLARMKGNALYFPADLHQGDATYKADITAIPFEDAFFDVVICHHVLEHIPDDAKALSEIRRVLKPGGFALLAVPQNHSLEHTYEDARITDPMERFWHFGAYDHKRFYGRDFPLRAAAAGFAVEAYRRPPGDEVRHALLRDEVLYVARHEAAGAPPR